MSDEKKVEQPAVEFQQLLDSVLEATPEEVLFMGKKRTIGWLHKGTLRKFSHVVQSEQDEWKQSVKLCAIILLNSYFKLRLCYWFYWRWLYYVRDPDAVELLRVVEAGKKKIPSLACSLLTILATGMGDVMMTMTAKEARATRAAQVGVPPTR